MSQLRTWLWGYFEEHGGLPKPSATFYQLLDMALEEEKVPLALEEAAMRSVSFLRGKGKDLTPEQQVEGIEPFICEAMRFILAYEAGRWHPIG
jgi:hypothetical protein